MKKVILICYLLGHAYIYSGGDPVKDYLWQYDISLPDFLEAKATEFNARIQKTDTVPEIKNSLNQDKMLRALVEYIDTANYAPNAKSRHRKNILIHWIDTNLQDQEIYFSIEKKKQPFINKQINIDITADLKPSTDTLALIADDVFYETAKSMILNKLNIVPAQISAEYAEANTVMVQINKEMAPINRGLNYLRKSGRLKSQKEWFSPATTSETDKKLKALRMQEQQAKKIRSIYIEIGEQLRASSAQYIIPDELSVVVLPEPVGPVT